MEEVKVGIQAVLELFFILVYDYHIRSFLPCLLST